MFKVSFSKVHVADVTKMVFGVPAPMLPEQRQWTAGPGGVDNFIERRVFRFKNLGVIQSSPKPSSSSARLLNHIALTGIANN